MNKGMPRHRNPPPPPERKVKAFFPWKNIEVWAEITCTCGYHSVIEGYFFYQFRCVGCGKIYKVPTEIELEEVEPNNEHSLTDINP
jgi:hypothetical protein